MAVVAGTKIVDDGLVFYYDMDNEKKSWKGEPTTNIITSQGINGAQGITYTYVTDEDGWSKYSISGTWASGTYPWSCRINSATFTGGVAYSARFLVKTNVREKYATFPDTTTGIHYVNDGNMTASGTKSSTSLGYDKNGLEITDVRNDGFIYSTGFANPTTSQTGFFHSRPLQDGTTFNSSTDFIWVKEIQVEEGSFTTPFVDGTRSNTQALLDLTGTNTITATSLTYNSDGTFEFDGTSDYISTNRNTITQNATYSFWANRTQSNNPYNMMGGIYLPYFSFRSSNVIHFSMRIDGTQQSLLTTSTFSNNTWYKFDFVHDYDGANTTALIYVNGELETSATYTGSQDASTGRTFMLGGWNSLDPTNYLFEGKIALCHVYEKALTADEVLNNFEATRGRFGI